MFLREAAVSKLASCHTEVELRDLLLGKNADAVGEHLLDCPKCGANAGRLDASDPLLVELSAPDETSTDGIFVEELRRRIKQPASAKTLPDEELTFLEPATTAFPADLGMFNRYRIAEKIGEGGMGMVFRAVDSNLQRTAALKIILPKYAANQKLRDRYIDEARATVKVRSPHVAEVYETNVMRGVPYLRMELLVGTMLDKKPIDALRRIEDRVCEGGRPHSNEWGGAELYCNDIQYQQFHPRIMSLSSSDINLS